MTTAPLPLYIIGAGGLAREALQVVRRAELGLEWSFVSFVDRAGGEPDDDDALICTDEVLLATPVPALVVSGIGQPELRPRSIHPYRDHPLFDFPNVLHPAATIDLEEVEMGNGNLVAAGVVFTVSIRIGSFNYFNLNCTVGHDVRFGDGCVVNPGANVSGGVEMGDGVLVGTGAQILQYVQIGAGATIGAGAVVTKDVAPGVTVVGAPARPLKG